MKSFYSIVLFCAFSIPSVSFDLDSLKNVWNDISRHDTDRLNAIDALAWEYRFSNPDSQYYYAELQYKFSEQLDNKKYMASSLATQSDYYAARGAYDKAIDLIVKSTKIYESIGYKYGLAGNCISLGNIYLDLKDYPGAMKQYKLNLSLLKEIGAQIDGAALNNIGEIYRETGDHQQALMYYTQSYQAHKNLGYNSGMSVALLNIGEVHKIEENYEDALRFYKRCLDRSIKSDDKNLISHVLSSMGNVYYEQGLLDKSDSITTVALQMAKEMGLVIEIRIASKCLYRVYKKLGKAKLALQMHELYTLIKDSMESNESSRKLMQKEYQYQYDQEQLVEEAKHNEEMVLLEEREKRQILISFGMGLGLIVLMFFVYLIYRKYKLADSQKILIEEKNKHITESIQYAKRIQHASLTSPEYLSGLFDDYFVFYQPKDIVSGDFYWAYKIDDNNVMVAVCDCTGHGVPGAFMSMISNSLLNEIVVDNGNYQVEKVLDILSSEVIKTLKQDKDKVEALDGLDMTLLMIDKKNKKVKFSGAGHTLYLVENGEVCEVKGDPYPVGYFFGRRKPYTCKEITLNQNDIVYLLSDGYTEQFGPENKKKFGYGAFKKLLLSLNQIPMSKQKEVIDNTINEWKANTQQVDDMLVMGIKF